MTTKTIANTYISGGYTLSASYATLTVAATGTIGGTGLLANAAATLDNEGTIKGAAGIAVDLMAGGSVQNGSTGNSAALITGNTGLQISGGPGSVVNDGSILGGGSAAVDLEAGGTVTNGSASDTVARMSGGLGVRILGGGGTVVNDGIVSAISGPGIYLGTSGSVTNGSAADTAALITGYAGIAAGTAGSGLATVANFGTIRGVDDGEFGVALYQGGSVTNGSTADTVAIITGGGGVEVETASGTVVNFGTISGGDQSGVQLSAGGSVTNGAASDSVALIQGAAGVFSTGSLTLVNFGTVLATGTFAVYGGGTASIINGSATDAAAVIGGAYGIVASGAAGIANFGTITGSSRQAISLRSGGTVTNGSTADTVALLHGYGEAIVGSGTVSVTNFGTVSSGYGSGAVGTDFAISLGAGTGTGSALVTNGSKSDKAAFISGFSGVELVGTATTGTLVNYGEIEGTGGLAVTFQSTTDLLKIEGGASFDGEVQGGGGALILDSRGGAGTLASFANYSGFATIEVAAGASWTLTGNGSIASGTTFTDAGRLTNLGTLSSPANEVIVSGAGVLVNGSTANSTASISGIVGVALTGAGTVTNFGTISGALYGVYVAPGDTATATVTNFGTILASGTYAAILAKGTAGGLSVVNGSAAETAALIEGRGLIFAGAATVANFGTVSNTSNYTYSIKVAGAARITNGSASDTSALVVGGGVIDLLGAGTVTNFGTLNTEYGGIRVEGEGLITNGSAADTAALIEGDNGASQGGIRLYGGGTVDNFGTVNGGQFESAIELSANTLVNPGGLIVNGSATDHAALIVGRYGIDAYNPALGPVTVVNFGTIDGTGSNNMGSAVYLSGPSDVLVVEAGSSLIGKAYGAEGTLELGAGGGAGTFANIGNNGTFNHFSTYLVQAGATWTLTGTNRTGSLVDDGTLINAGTIEAEVQAHGGSLVNQQGATLASTGGAVYGAAGSVDRVTNLGVVTAGGFAPAIAFAAGGSVANGSNSDTTALIRSSAAGVEIAGAAGTVTNYGTISGALAGWDVVLGEGGMVVNGGLLGTTAVIDGVEVQGAAGKVANFGTLTGGAVAGVALLAGGSVTNGSAADKLALISGSTGIELLGAGTVTNFGTIGATAPGEAAVRLGAASDVLVDEAGAVFQGTVIGDGGTLDLAAGAGAGQLAGLGTSFAGFTVVDALAGASWTLTGASTIAAGTTLTSAGALTLKGSSLVAGAVGGTGSIDFDTGTATLAGGVAFTIAHWSITGAAVVTDGLAKLTYAGTFTGFGSTLSLGGNALTLAGASGFTNLTVGRSGTFTTAGKTKVAGLTLSGSVHWLNGGAVTETGEVVVGDVGSAVALAENLAGGVIDIVDTSGISLGGGAGAFNLSNAGLVEKTLGSGRSMIGVIVANTGTISVLAGTLDLEDAVTGTGGMLRIGKGASLELGGTVASGQTVAFTGASAMLLLDQPTAFKAAVDGFAAGDRIDLAGFVHGSGETVSYKAATGKTPDGTLTVTDGALKASIGLFGQYTAAGFKLATDGHGGSLVTYVPPAASPLVIAAHG